MSIKDKYIVERVSTFQCKDWLLGKHYAKRMPSISYAFGLFGNRILQGVLTVGKPASPFLCVGVCGVEMSQYVFELNRLVVTEGLERNVLSYFVASSLKQIKNNLILVSYADTSKGHHGYIYQATNWIYTGKTVERTDIGIDDNSHSRHYDRNTDYATNRKFRSAKHRYIYFIGKRKTEFQKALNYQIQPYPKGDNQRYDASYEPITQSLLF